MAEPARLEADAGALYLTGTPGITYRIEQSSDFSEGSWKVFTNMVAGTSPVAVVVPPSLPSATRFLRARTIP